MGALAGMTRIQLGAFAALLVSSTAYAQERLTLVSLDSNGNAGDGDSASNHAPSMSTDGRHVVFASRATNLVQSDNNGVLDVFAHDRLTGVTSRVSVSSTGVESDGDCDGPSISADGRVIAFRSRATNLVASDTNGQYDVFVHDRDPDGNGTFDEGNGITTRVSVRSNGREGNASSSTGWISGAGDLIVFQSDATNLVVGDTNGQADVFLHNLVTATTQRVSVDSAGLEANGRSWGPRISSDGSVVAFTSGASSLVSSDTNGKDDVFVRDLANKLTIRVSVDSSGAQGDDASSGPPSLSSDGSLIAFHSAARNLVTGDVNARYDAFVHDRTTGSTTRISVSSAGVEGDLDSHSPFISAAGNLVAFASYASTFDPSDQNGYEDIYIHDRRTGATMLSSTNCIGDVGNSTSNYAAISEDEQFVAYGSWSSNLVDADTNNTSDVFVHDLSITEPDASWSNYGSGWPGTLGIPSLVSNVDPEFGATVTISIGNSSGANTTGLLLLGVQSASIPTVKGGTILVLPISYQLLSIPAAGASMTGSIPADPSYCGQSFFLQVLEVDSGASLGLSFTSGLELVIGL